MLLSKTAVTKWNSKIYKHYIDLGYEYTGKGTPLEVKVEDLTQSSHAMVSVKCDYCGRIYQIPWYNYIKNHKTIIQTDACCNIECTEAKASDSIIQKYGSRENHISIMLAKGRETNIERYGCENPFGNEQVKEKLSVLRNDIYEQYGQYRTPESVDKAKATCIKKYGVSNYTKTLEYRELYSGENSPVWKADSVKRDRTERGLPEYRDWRKAVFDRDYYTCQCCGARNGNGKYIRLEAHHILDFKNHKDKIFDIDNGITLCMKCHTLFHSLYGKHGNDNIQLQNFLHRQYFLQRIKRYAELLGIKPIELQDKKLAR